VVVARTEITKRTIVTLDDGSGANIDVCVLQSDPKDRDKTQPATSQASNISKAEPDVPTSHDAGQNTDTKSQAPLMQTVHVSATDRTILDITSLRPGTTVKVKGTLSRFRATMQLNLERFTLIRDTNAEMQFVDERLQFLVEVLAVPWLLRDVEIEQLRAEADKGDLKAIEERQRAERRVKRRAEQEERDYRHIQKRYEREERKRAKEAVVCKEDGVNVMRDIRRRKILAADGTDRTRDKV
jgi:hypothetical protein